jgi:preprotein translocase subunit SecG
MTLLILDGILLVTVVLLQSGKGSGLAAEFGGVSSSTDSFLGGRQAATLLTKMSWWTGGIFMALSFILAILSAQARAPESILQGELAPTTQQEAPTPLLQREQQGQEKSGGQDQSSGATPQETLPFQSGQPQGGSEGKGTSEKGRPPQGGGR